VHGTPTWSYEWRHLLGTMSAKHEVLALDPFGFGRCERPPDAASTPEAHAPAQGGLCAGGLAISSTPSVSQWARLLRMR
jgi:hypothetical protein